MPDNVVGKAVSAGRGGAQSMKFGAGHGMGEKLTGTTLIGISGTGSKGVWTGDEGAGWAWQIWTGLCSGTSCMGLGKGLGLGTPRRVFRKWQVHCLYKTA